MAESATKKDFDAFVKKVNSKFAEIDTAIKEIYDDMNKQEQATVDSINKSFKAADDIIKSLHERITKLEQAKKL